MFSGYPSHKWKWFHLLSWIKLLEFLHNSMFNSDNQWDKFQPLNYLLVFLFYLDKEYEEWCFLFCHIIRLAIKYAWRLLRDNIDNLLTLIIFLKNFSFTYIMLCISNKKNIYLFKMKALIVNVIFGIFFNI